jgi:hypothetical protein
MSEVSRLVYLVALMIDIGEDLVELMTEHDREMLGARVPEGDGFVIDRARPSAVVRGLKRSRGRVCVTPPQADARPESPGRGLAGVARHAVHVRNLFKRPSHSPFPPEADGDQGGRGDGVADRSPSVPDQAGNHRRPAGKIPLVS